jgi:hypothetical protein
MTEFDWRMLVVESRRCQTSYAILETSCLKRATFLRDYFEVLMHVYSLGCETSRGLAISMGDGHKYEDYWYLHPDSDLKNPIAALDGLRRRSGRARLFTRFKTSTVRARPTSKMQ